MTKIDDEILKAISSSKRFDAGIAQALGVEERVDALVRVQNPVQLAKIEKNFDVTCIYPFIRSVGIKCAISDAMRLDRMSEVEYVSKVSSVLALEEESNGENFEEVASLADDKLDGRGVTLCVMDTGVGLHSDLVLPKDRIVHFVDMIGGETLPYDDNGHGTFVTGVATGNGMLSGRKIMGVAPAANVVGIKAIGANGESGTFKILDGMQWLFDNFRQYGIRVVCMSFGAQPQAYRDPLKLGAEMLVKSGLIVVAASGNSGKNNLRSPAISSQVIAVGAVDREDRLAKFTSVGSYNGTYRPDVFCDGVEVRGLSNGGTYSNMSGTSVAAPYVAGACCLLCQKFRGITPRQAKAMIVGSSFLKDGMRIFRLK